MLVQVKVIEKLNVALSIEICSLDYYKISL